MNAQKHISTPWILCALACGVILFSVVLVGSEIQVKKHEQGTTTIPDRFKEMNTEELSTPLNTRYESLGPDQYCLNDLELTSASEMEAWKPVRTFLEGHFYEAAGDLELKMRESLTQDANRVTVSTCYFGEELYTLDRAGQGEEMSGYNVSRIDQGEGAQLVSEFIVPLGRTLAMRTDLFKEETLGISAREGDASHTSWYYFKMNMDDYTLTQVEWCDRWFGGGFSPYGDEPTLNCEYVYQF